MEKLLVVLFLCFSFSPYIRVLPISATTQPNALLCACILFLLIRKYEFPKLVYYLFFLLLCATVALVLAGGEALAVKDWGNYLSLAVCTAVTIHVAINYRELMYKLFYMFVWLWFIAGVIQYFIDPVFLSSFIYRMSGSFVGGRGAASMSAEPTYYGLIMCTMFSIYLVMRWFEKSKFLGIFIFVQLVFMSKSATSLVVVAGAFATLSVYILFKARFIHISLFLAITIIIAFIGSLYADAIFETRIGRVLEGFDGRYELILATDYSISERFNHIVLPIMSLSDNYFIPQGFGGFGDYFLKIRSNPSNSVLFSHPVFLGPPARILSGYGKLFFEMGLFGLAMPLLFVISVWNRIKSSNSYFFGFVLFNYVLFMAFPFMTSIVPLGIGIFLVSSSKVNLKTGK